MTAAPGQTCGDLVDEVEAEAFDMAAERRRRARVYELARWAGFSALEALAISRADARDPSVRGLFDAVEPGMTGGADRKAVRS